MVTANASCERKLQLWGLGNALRRQVSREERCCNDLRITSVASCAIYESMEQTLGGFGYGEGPLLAFNASVACSGVRYLRGRCCDDLHARSAALQRAHACQVTKGLGPACVWY